MELSSTSLLPRLCTLARSAYRAPYTLARPISTGRPRAPTFTLPPPARRTFERAPPPSSSPALGPTDSRTSTGTGARKPDKTSLFRRPTNRQIPFSHVYVVDPDTHKLSTTKQSLEDLLATHRKERRIVELVASHPQPIVRLTTRSEVEARYREMKRAVKKGARAGEEPKEVQFTWGVAWADVEHKLRKARRDLDKGYRVVVVITVKRGHRPSSRQELVTFADEISKVLGDVGKEWREREVTDRTMTLSFQKSGDVS